MSLLSTALCSSTAFLSHQSDFSARMRSCLQASLYAAVVDLVLLVYNTFWWAWSLLLIRVCSPSPGVFCLACQDMSWLCCIRPAAELPIPHLVLRFPSPPIGREHCPFSAQNPPYGWWYLVLQCWAWSAYFSLACCAFVAFWKPRLTSASGNRSGS